MRALLAALNPFGRESQSPGWDANRPCAAIKVTPRMTHICGKRGAHHKHLCRGPRCTVTWREA